MPTATAASSAASNVATYGSAVEASLGLPRLRSSSTELDKAVALLHAKLDEARGQIRDVRDDLTPTHITLQDRRHDPPHERGIETITVAETARFVWPILKRLIPYLALGGGGGFLGFCKEQKDNSTGSINGGTAGSTTIEIEAAGLVWLPVASAGFDRTSIDATVYASDTDTFTVTVGTNIPIGKIVLVPDAAITGASGTFMVLVAFEAACMRSI